jgi:hypothetical protein
MLIDAPQEEKSLEALSTRSPASSQRFCGQPASDAQAGALLFGAGDSSYASQPPSAKAPAPSARYTAPRIQSAHDHPPRRPRRQADQPRDSRHGGPPRPAAPAEIMVVQPRRVGALALTASPAEVHHKLLLATRRRSPDRRRRPASDPACSRRWPPSAAATSSSCPSSTGSLARFLTPA